MRQKNRVNVLQRKRRAFPTKLRRTPYALALALSMADPGTVRAEVAGVVAVPAGVPRFTNQYFRDADGNPMDVSRFSHGNPVSPGNYTVELYINGVWVSRRDLDIGVEDNGAAAVCLDLATLLQAGFDIQTLPGVAGTGSLLADAPCINPVKTVPGARVRFDSAEQRLDLELPQAYLRRVPRGYVDPDLWDDGVTAALLGYDANVYRSGSQGVVSTHGYLGLDGGFNLHGWQLRHQGNVTIGQPGAGSAMARYTVLNSHVRRDIRSLHARFVGGQFFTPGDMFDGFGFTGVQFSSDDRMLPDTVRSYAPVVRGVASSNARVTVRQGSSVVYETSVPPGPFVIDDLYDTGYAGDLAVTVTEADDSSHEFLVPYASIAQLLRPGTYRFSTSAGTLRDQNASGNPPFLQGTYRHGVNNGVTLYGGMTIAGQYQSVLGGAAFSTPVGAISADIAHSWAQGIPDMSAQGADRRVVHGRTYRLSYSKRLELTDSNITLGAFQYSSEGFMSLPDVERWRDSTFHAPTRMRRRLQLSLSQHLPRSLGSLYFNGYSASYWQPSASDLGFAAGYSRAFRFGMLNLTVQRGRTQWGRFDTQAMVTVSLPLGRLSGTPVTQLRVGYGSGDAVATQASVSGAGNDERTLHYNAYGEYRRSCCGSANRDGGSGNGGFSVSYNSGIGTLGAAVSGGAGYFQMGATMSGGLVAHPLGLTMSRRIGEAVAVVAAPGATGASLLNANGVRINGRGYAIQPMLAPYRMNEVGLDGAGLGDDIDMLDSSSQVVPGSGAVVVVKLATRQGQPLMFRVLRASGKPVPPGAQVFGSGGMSIATAGQGGLIFLRSQPGMHTFTVKWGAAPHQRCVFHHTVGAVPGDRQAPQRPALSVTCNAEDRQ